MKFNLITIAYVFALLAAGMAAFGAVGGTVVTCLALAWWMAPPKVGCVVWLIIGVFSLFVPHCGSEFLQLARHHACLSNVKQIALGIQYYEDEHGELPPAATFDQSGKPLHSWRSAILPHIGQQALHSQLAMDQPWDSSINRGYTVDMHVGTYECPAHGGSAATGHYLAVVGERTAWPPGRGRKLSEVKDGTPNTVMVIEAPWVGAAWAEPKDFSFDEAVEYLTRRPAASETAHVVQQGFFYKPQPVVHVAYMNGREGVLPLPLPREVAVALLTVDGGEQIDEAALDVHRAAELDYGRCYAFAAFVALAVLPAARLRRKAESREGSPAAR